jgi:hypothetical protein
MTTKPEPVPAKHAWQASIDGRLVARLVRPLRPGLIGSGLAHRIVGGVDAMARRLGLLERFPRLAGSVATAGAPAIVHVAWPRASEARGGEAGGGLDASAGARSATPGELMRVVPSRVVEPERRIERTIVERVAPVAVVPMAPAASAGTAGREASMTQLAPEPRRLRMGAPLSKLEMTQVVSPGTRHAHTLANARPGAAPPPVAASALVVAARPRPDRSAHTRPEGLPAEPAAVIEASRSVVPRRSRIAAAGVATAIAALPDVVVPNSSRRRSSRRLASVLPQPVARANEPVASRELVALPRRSQPGAQAAELPLAHVASPSMAAPIATRHPAPVAPRELAAPAAPPTPRAVVAGRSSSTPPPPPRLDLHDIAARVQLILQRQLSHERARRGLSR